MRAWLLVGLLLLLAGCSQQPVESAAGCEFSIGFSCRDWDIEGNTVTFDLYNEHGSTIRDVSFTATRVATGESVACTPGAGQIIIQGVQRFTCEFSSPVPESTRIDVKGSFEEPGGGFPRQASGKITTE